MKRGKKICNALRDVRRQIAAANDIPYEITPCPHDGGQCPGTCPKCESELRYIENQLSLRRAAGKAVSIVGLSLGISAAFAANAPQAPTAKCDTVASANDSTESNHIFGGVEQQPEFPGGEAALMKFIKDNLKYPADAARDSIEGRVTLCFTVEIDGTITEIEVMRSPDTRLSEEAIRVVKMMPRWKPVTRRGKAVSVKYVLPVTFRLRGLKAQQQQPSANTPQATATNRTQPEFPGGETALMNYIKKNLHYPKYAASRRISGRVILSYIVEKDGSISGIEVIKSPHQELTNEAIRVIKSMPRWKPGTENGEPVRVKYVLPVTFRLK